MSLKKGDLIDFDAHLVGRSRNAAKPRCDPQKRRSRTAGPIFCGAHVDAELKRMVITRLAGLEITYLAMLLTKADQIGACAVYCW